MQTNKDNKKRGRKPIDDKKLLLRLYIRQSIVDANGGVESAQEKATDYLHQNAKSND